MGYQGCAVTGVISPSPVPSKVLDILRIREEEAAANKMTVSIYDTERNEKSKEQREAMVGDGSHL